MPQTIEVPNEGVIEFPDGMPDAEIKSVIKRKFYIEPALKSVDIADKVFSVVQGILNNPLAAEGSAMGREQAQAEREGPKPEHKLADAFNEMFKTEARPGVPELAEAPGEIDEPEKVLPQDAARLAADREHSRQAFTRLTEKLGVGSGFWSRTGISAMKAIAGAADWAIDPKNIPLEVVSAGGGAGAGAVEKLLGAAGRLVMGGQMVKGFHEGAQEIQKVIDKPGPLLPEDKQKLSDLLWTTLAMGYGAGKFGEAGVEALKQRLTKEGTAKTQLQQAADQAKDVAPMTAAVVAKQAEEPPVAAPKMPQDAPEAKTGVQVPPKAEKPDTEAQGAPKEAPTESPEELQRQLATEITQPETGQDASEVQEAAKTHGDVPAQPVEGEERVPAEEGGEGVRPQAEGRVQAQGTEGVLEPEAPKRPQPETRLTPANKAKTPEEKAFRGTVEGQKAMASRAIRIATLQMMNDGIRKIDPNEAYDRSLIEQLPDSQIDAWMEDLRKTWNKLHPPKQEPERITAAAYMPEGATKPETGPHHPGILARLGVKGFETRESRNTPQFGYQTNLREFVPRGDEAARIAKEADQQLEPFDVDPNTGEQVPHSDEIAAVPGGEKPLSETKVAEAPVAKPASKAKAVQKVESEVQKVAAIEGQRPAKEVKAELLARIEEAMKGAPEKSAYNLTTHGVVEIDIPGDGTFKVARNLTDLGEMRDRVKRISTTSGTAPKPAKASGVGTIADQAEAVTKAYGSAEAAYGSTKRQLEALQSQEPPASAEDRETWNKQIQGAEHLLKEIYGNTKAAALETKAESARDRVATYKEGAKNFEETIAKIEAIKRKNQAHKDRLADLKERYAQNQQFIKENERNAEQWEQEAAKEKAKLGIVDRTVEAAPTPETSPAIQGMGGAVPSEFQTGGKATSNKNAVVDQERAERGLPPMMAPLKETFGEWWTEAMAKIDQDPGVQDRLIAELLEKPRPLTGWENAALLQRRADLRNEYEKATRDGAQAYADGRQEGVDEARLRVADWSDKLATLEQAVGKGGAGTESGRSLAARKMMMNSDYSLAAMEMQKRAAKGFEPLTDAERAELVDLQKKIQESEQKYQEHVATAQQRISELEAQRTIDQAKAEAAPKFDKRVLDYAERIVKKMENAADAARQRIMAKWGQPGAQAGPFDPTLIDDFAIIGSAKIARMGLDLAKWTDAMVSDFGERIKPMLQEIWAASNKVLDEGLAKAPDEVKKFVKKQAPIERIQTAKENIGAKVRKGEQSEISPLVQKLVRAIVERQPDIARDALVDEVHGVLKEFMPDMDRREAMDAISGYGDFKPLTKDAISVRVRDLKGQLQQVAKLEDLQAKQPLQKTGIERRPPSDEERKLIKQVNEAKRRYGVVVTDPATQLRSALDARKTYYRNQITDLQAQIDAKEKFVKTKTPSPTDPELEGLKQQRDELKKQFDEVFKKPEMTDEQRLKLAQAAAERNEKLWTERLANAKKGMFDWRKPVAKRPTNATIESIRARANEAKEQAQLLRDLSPEYQAGVVEKSLTESISEYERKIKEGDLFAKQKPSVPDNAANAALRAKRDALAKQLSELLKASPVTQAKLLSKAIESAKAHGEELSRRINEGDIAARTKAPSTASSPELESLKEENAQLSKMLREMQNAARPRKSPEQIALQTLKTRLSNSIAKLQDKIAAGDFSVQKREPRTVMDSESMSLKATHERLKKQFQEGLILDRMKNRTWWEKMLDWGTKYRRAGVLSSPTVIPKLISAGLQRLASLPLEELAGEVAQALPGVKQVSARAPLEGGGLNMSAELAGYKGAYVQGLKDAWQVLKTGHSDLDIIYGKPKESYTGEFEMASKLLNFPGRLHGLIKAPIKRAVFERAVDRLSRHYAAQGLDIADPMVKTRIGIEAYKAGNRGIFLQDNFLANKVAGFLAEKTDPSTGHTFPGSKVFSTAGRIALPITRVPINIVAETMQYIGGLASGSVRLGNAFRKGFDNLPPERADLIMRELKKGSVGAAVMLLGYFSPNVVGGYYQPGKKQKKGDVPYGRIRIYGVDIPTWLLHNPLLETLQFGATIRHVADSHLRKKDKEEQGVVAGIGAAALGLTEEVPFVREMSELEKLRSPYTRGTFVGEQAKSIVVPSAVQRAAEWTDPAQKRKPGTVMEHIKTGIPGLREQVPEDRRPRPIP